MSTLQIHYFDDQWRPDPAGMNWRAAADAEIGSSVVVARAWARWGAKWGSSTFRVVAWDATKPIGEADVRSRDYWELPAGTRSFTVEGRRQNAGVVPHASLLQLAK